MEDLPDEVLQTVFGHLSRHSSNRCSRVCKRFFEQMQILSNDEEYWLLFVRNKYKRLWWPLSCLKFYAVSWHQMNRVYDKTELHLKIIRRIGRRLRFIYGSSGSDDSSGSGGDESGYETSSSNETSLSGDTIRSSYESNYVLDTFEKFRRHDTEEYLDQLCSVLDTDTDDHGTLLDPQQMLSSTLDEIREAREQFAINMQQAKVVARYLLSYHKTLKLSLEERKSCRKVIRVYATFPPVPEEICNKTFVALQTPREVQPIRHPWFNAIQAHKRRMTNF